MNMSENTSLDYHLKLARKELSYLTNYFSIRFLKLESDVASLIFGGNPLERTEPENLKACFP